MAYGSWPGDLYVDGNLSARTFTPPAASVGNTAIAGSAGIETSKLDHRYIKTYAQDSTTDATVERRVLHTVYGATATLVKFSVGSITPAAAAGNAVCDLLKNGSSILSAAITLDSSNTARVLEDASGYTSTALVAGDVLEFKVTSVAATKPIGVFCRLIVDEDTP